jgi:hypothetical protein
MTNATLLRTAETEIGAVHWMYRSDILAFLNGQSAVFIETRQECLTECASVPNLQGMLLEGMTDAQLATSLRMRAPSIILMDAGVLTPDLTTIAAICGDECSHTLATVAKWAPKSAITAARAVAEAAGVLFYLVVCESNH